MAQNTIKDLNNHLFEEMERLNDEELTAEGIKKETIRAKAMVSVARAIIESDKTVLSALKMNTENPVNEIPKELKMLPDSKEKK